MIVTPLWPFHLIVLSHSSLCFILTFFCFPSSWILSLSLCLISVWLLTFSIRWLLMVSILLPNFFTFCFLDHLKQTYYSLYLRLELPGLPVIVFLLTLAFLIMLSFLSGYFSSNLQKNCNSSPKNFPLTCCRHDAPWLPGILGCISCT